MFVFLSFLYFSHQEADVVDGEALEDVCKARLEVDRLAAEHRDACNVACQCHTNVLQVLEKCYRNIREILLLLKTEMHAMLPGNVIEI